MPPKKESPTCFLFKFADITIFLPISSSMTLSSIKEQLLEALPKDDPAVEAAGLSKVEQVGVWKNLSKKTGQPDKDENDNWELLEDESSKVLDWGLKESAILGLSFSSNGKFPEPQISEASEGQEMEE